MNSEQNIKMGVLLSYLSIGMNLAIALLYTPFMLRTMGNQQYGLYNMASSAINFLNLTEFGFSGTLIYYATKYRTGEEKEKVSSIYGLFSFIFAIIAVVVLASGSLICYFSDDLFVISTGSVGYRQLKIVIIIFVLNMALTFFMQPYNAILLAHEKFIYLKGFNLILIVLKPLITIPFLLNGYKAITVALVYSILTQFYNIVNVLFVKKILKVRIDYKVSNIDFLLIKEIIAYSFFIFVSMIALQLNENADNILLGVISGEFAVAVYAFGYQMSVYIEYVPSVISSLLFPRIVTRVSQGIDKNELTEIMLRIGRIQYIVIFPLVSGFILFGKEFICLWAGETYESAYWIIVVLAVPAVIPNIQSTGIHILQSLNRHKFRAVVGLIAAIMNVLVSIPAGIRFGAIGCATCTGIVIFVFNGIIMNWYYSVQVGLQMKAFWYNIFSLFRISIPVSLIGILLNCVLKEYRWLHLFVKVFTYGLIYLVYMLLVGMNQYEKNLIRNFFGKKRENN